MQRKVDIALLQTRTGDQRPKIRRAAPVSDSIRMMMRNKSDGSKKNKNIYDVFILGQLKLISQLMFRNPHDVSLLFSFLFVTV